MTQVFTSVKWISLIQSVIKSTFIHWTVTFSRQNVIFAKSANQYSNTCRNVQMCPIAGLILIEVRSVDVIWYCCRWQNYLQNRWMSECFLLFSFPLAFIFNASSSGNGLWLQYFINATLCIMVIVIHFFLVILQCILVTAFWLPSLWHHTF